MQGDREKWSEYLAENEKILAEYTIGSNDVLATDKRVIILKKFPRSFTEAKYPEILALEHKTYVLWENFLKALLFLAAGVFLYNYSASNNLAMPIYDIVSQYLPELTGIFSVGVIKSLLSIAVILLIALGVINTIRFVSSARGHLRIRLKTGTSIRIRTAFTPQVRELIKLIETQLEEKAPEVTTRIPARAVKEVFERKKKKAEEVAPEPEVENLETIRKKLKKVLERFKPNAISLISTKSEPMNIVTAMLQILLSEEKYGGVFISVSRPYEEIMKAMNTNRIRSDDIYFIDCISHAAGKRPEEAENVVFVENPSSLEEISMYVDKEMNKVKSKNRFILLDSLSSLLIYNNEDSAKEFSHFLINHMRVNNIGGVILTMEKKEVEELVKTLVPMCDMFIEL